MALPGNRKMSIPSSSPENSSSREVSRSYRDYYYASKLGWTRADKNATLLRRRIHARDYIEGLHWVLNYYHNGCKSWDWYFPHLYSPLSTDLVNLDEFYEDEITGEDGFKAFKFDAGEPFPSLAQLLSVLPPQSADLLPKPLGDLMLQPFSPLIEYYPADFTADSNGKRQTWEAVVQIPFIDSERLLDSVNDMIAQDQEAGENAELRLFSNAERLRNKRGKSHLFLAPQQSNADSDGAMPSLKSKAKPAQSSFSKPTTTNQGNAGVSRRQQGNPRRPKSRR